MARNRNRGGGGPQQGGQQNRGGQVNLELFLDGKRDALDVSVRLFQGNNPKTGEVVNFCIGTEANPYKNELILAGTTLQIRIGANGIGSHPTTLDLSSIPLEFTTITAMALGKTVTKPLPVESNPPGKGPKVNRIKVSPEGDSRSLGEPFQRDIQTLAMDGKTLEISIVRIVTTQKVTLKNLADGSVMARKVKFHEFLTDEGLAHIEIDFVGLKCEVRVIHVASGQEIKFNLNRI